MLEKKFAVAVLGVKFAPGNVVAPKVIVGMLKLNPTIAPVCVLILTNPVKGVELLSEKVPDTTKVVCAKLAVARSKPAIRLRNRTGTFALTEISVLTLARVMPSLHSFPRPHSLWLLDCLVVVRKLCHSTPEAVKSPAKHRSAPAVNARAPSSKAFPQPALWARP